MSETSTLRATPTGYQDYEDYWALEYHQGGRQTFEVNLTLSSIPRFVAAPNPDSPIEGNRRVDVRHAKGIASYVRERANGLIPTIVLRCPSRTLEFIPNPDVQAGGGVRFGTLRVPKANIQDLNIVDGQHRVLGLDIAVRDLGEERMKLKSEIADANETGNSVMKKELEGTLSIIEEQLSRISRERVTVQIVIVDSIKEFKQIFVDMNDTAKGVKLSQVIEFDSSNPLYQASIKLADHPLFSGKTDREKNIVGDSSADLVSLANLFQFVRAASFGITGRISDARMKEVSRDIAPLVQSARASVDRLIESFPVLEQVSSGALTPAEARAKSPLARANTMRVLIGADWALRSIGLTPAEITFLFSQLNPDLSGAFTSSNRLQIASGSAFPLGAMAPGSRNQNLKDAVSVIVGFCIDPASAPAKWLVAGREKLAAVGARV